MFPSEQTSKMQQSLYLYTECLFFWSAAEKFHKTAEIMFVFLLIKDYQTTQNIW